MFAKDPRITSLVTRKQLLIADSELNRAQLAEEWQTMAQGVGGLVHRAKTVGTWVSAAGLLVAGLTTLCQKRARRAETRPSVLQSVLEGAQLAKIGRAHV